MELNLEADTHEKGALKPPPGFQKREQGTDTLQKEGIVL
jgi:hypothetical protein